MPSKRIDELTTRTVADTDLLPVTPSGGPSGSATVAAIVAEGLSQPNSASAGAGASITIKAADGVTSGAGGSITITPGAQATTGGPGKVVIDTLTVGRGASGVATNTAVGVNALSAVTSGLETTAIGSNAGAKITNGNQNTFVGEKSGAAVTTGGQNTALGRAALEACVSGNDNTCVGFTTGLVLTGSANAIFGSRSGTALSTANNSTFLGAYAGGNTTTGSGNVCVGISSGRFQPNGSTALATAANSIYIGTDCRGFSNSDSNSIVIGYLAIGEGANTVVIGNSSTVQQHFYATRYIKTEGSLVFASSTPAAIVANQNDYVLTGSAFQRLNCTTASDITGIAPPTGGAHVDGRMIRLVNVGTATVTLKHNDAASTAANRMFVSTGADKALAVNAWADLVYDATNNGSGAAGWRVM